MASAILPGPVQTFLATVPDLDETAWRTVFQTRTASLKTGFADAREKAGTSASMFSALQKATLAALKERMDVVLAADRMGFLSATNTVEAASLALISRDKLAPEEFELLIAPFLAAGVSRAVFDEAAA
jgi:hypothetical protein